MISKELLSEVLNVNVQTEIHEDDLCIDNILIYWEFDGYRNECRNINIYELAHECKQWAFNNGYYLTIYNDAIDIILKTNCKMVENITDGSFKYSPILVFKACQYIMENKCGS